MLLDIIGMIIGGLIIGALGRLAVPGPNPMSLPVTAVVGIGGGLLGGLVGRALFGRPGGLILAVIGAAVIVFVVAKMQARNDSGY